MHSTIQGLKRFLRSPAVITVELAVIAVAGVIGASFPQAGIAGSGALERLRELAPPVAAAGLALGLDHVFRSVWFLAAVGAMTISLLVVVTDQIRGLPRTLATRGFVAAGSPILHVGLLLLILAGGVRVLFGSEAVVDLLEGETLPPTVSAWPVQRPGPLAAPIGLTQSVDLGGVNARRYPSGDLHSLSARLRLAESGGIARRDFDVPVNGYVTVAGTRLHVGRDYGPAALVEWRGVSNAVARMAVLLKNENGRWCEAVVEGHAGERAYLRAVNGSDGRRPAVVEVRVMRGDLLLYAGSARVGETIPLPGGDALSLHGLPYWVRLHASRDPSLGFMYAGLLLVAAGMLLLFLPSSFRPGMSATPQPAYLLVVTLAISVTGCGGVSRPEAKRLVERYNAVVAEAYRRGDVKLVDGVVGPEEGRKLTGLIGVRLDMGVAMDSKMLSLEVLDVASKGDLLKVRTRERWRYCDRQIGTGTVVGEESEDEYVMLYHLARSRGRWLVERIEFAAPPKIGRKQSHWSAGHEIMPVMAAAGKPTDEKEVATP